MDKRYAAMALSLPLAVLLASCGSSATCEEQADYLRKMAHRGGRGPVRRELRERHPGTGAGARLTVGSPTPTCRFDTPAAAPGVGGDD
ncbi:hypothetical protein ACN27B_02210 [Micromonospora sp. WMMD754]|uniref:hypothetical protein n=1 Tax=Micromonospora sp. WMMD754 TaxID=3404114 RepID=UPI003BF5E0EE